jgi:GNAT superfamily N-acetyltransferase
MQTGSGQPAMTMVHAEQIASLINERNLLTKELDSETIYKEAESYEFEIQGDKVVACLQRKKLQWYQWEILHLSVSKDHEGEGLAYGLYKRAEDQAIRKRARLLQCTIRDGNAASEKFFTRQRFVRVNRFSNEQSGHTVVVWQKVLAKASDVGAGLTKARYIAAATALLLLVLSIFLVLVGPLKPLPGSLGWANSKVLQVIFWLTWSVLPPVWFLFENSLFWREIPAPDQALVDRFKHNQDLASKLWIAIAAAFLLLYFDSKPH